MDRNKWALTAMWCTALVPPLMFCTEWRKVRLGKEGSVQIFVVVLGK